MISNEADRKLLALMQSYGSDLSKPHHITHYFYLKSQKAARAVADELEREGCFPVHIEPVPASGWRRVFGIRQWSCIAEIEVVPSEAQVFAATNRYNRLASAQGGEYDGWDADFVKG